MTMNQKIEDAMNKQINAEMYSAYLYLSMSSYFESKNLTGFANWMKIQAQEEISHAMKFYQHLHERGGKVVLDSIEKPDSEWSSPLEVFENVFEHEKKVTSMINSIVEISDSEKDYASKGILQWFIDEQIEEESSADEILQKLKLAKDSPGGLFMMDQELGKRVFVATDQKEE